MHGHIMNVLIHHVLINVRRHDGMKEKRGEESKLWQTRNILKLIFMV